MNVVALCALGAERALSNELKKLNLTVHESIHGKVRFSADLPGLYHALMGLRTADRVLLEVAHFSAVDFDQLFEGVKSVPWESYLHRGSSVVVEKVRSSRSHLSAVTSIQSVAHKALAERLCKAWQVDRLNEDEQNAEVRLYVDKDQVEVLLDLSGEPSLSGDTEPREERRPFGKPPPRPSSSFRDGNGSFPSTIPSAVRGP